MSHPTSATNNSVVGSETPAEEPAIVVISTLPANTRLDRFGFNAGQFLKSLSPFPIVSFASEKEMTERNTLTKNLEQRSSFRLVYTKGTLKDSLTLAENFAGQLRKLLIISGGGKRMRRMSSDEVSQAIVKAIAAGTQNASAGEYGTMDFLSTPVVVRNSSDVSDLGYVGYNSRIGAVKASEVTSREYQAILRSGMFCTSGNGTDSG